MILNVPHFPTVTPLWNPLRCSLDLMNQFKWIEYGKSDGMSPSWEVTKDWCFHLVRTLLTSGLACIDEANSHVGEDHVAKNWGWSLVKSQQEGFISLAVQCLVFSVGVMGSIPGGGAKIPHASWPKKQNMKRKDYYSKFNKDYKNVPHQKKKKKEKKKKLRRSWGSLIQQPLGIESCQQWTWKASSSPVELWDDWSHKCHLDCSLWENLRQMTQLSSPRCLTHRNCDIANVLNVYTLGGNLLHSNRWLIQMPPPKLVPAHPLDFISQNSLLIHNTPGTPALLKPPRPLRHVLSLEHSQRLFHLPEMPFSLQDLSYHWNLAQMSPLQRGFPWSPCLRSPPGPCSPSSIFTFFFFFLTPFSIFCLHESRTLNSFACCA